MSATFSIPAVTSADLATSVDRLRAVVRCRVVTPTDPAYTELAPPFNLAGAFDPVAVVEVLDATDVSAVVRHGAASGLEVTARATGHGAVPRVRRPATLIVDTTRLEELTITEHAGVHTARVGAGVRWGKVLDEAGALGLAAPAGSAPAVGVVGYVTGGGLSPVGRTTGYASDHVVAFEVVTGDGELRRATAEQNTALFWGLRGGKGALGIVTAVEIELFEMPTVFGGCEFFDATDDEDLLATWAEWSAALPDEASTSVATFNQSNLTRSVA